MKYSSIGNFIKYPLKTRKKIQYNIFMYQDFSFSAFLMRFPDDTSCLEEIKKIRFPDGIFYDVCKRETQYYRLKNRNAYSCKFCRHQIYPLANTIFEKTTTPLRIWFYAFFLMTHMKTDISIKKLQQELGVTYKTAWRINHAIGMLLKQNNGDLLMDALEKVHKWTFFNKLEIKL